MAKTLVINMPEIARFYGIVIKLFFGDRPPPHFHAVYGGYIALFNIETLEMIEGDLPNRAKKLVIEWATKNHLINKMFQPTIKKPSFRHPARYDDVLSTG